MFSSDGHFIEGVERLATFGRGSYEEHLCVVILNLGHQFRKDVV